MSKWIGKRRIYNGPRPELPPRLLSVNDPVSYQRCFYYPSFPFRCSVCDSLLYCSNFYFEKDGLLFCKNDYFQKFGEVCQKCGQVVSGPLMVAGEHRFHPECFVCHTCNSVIGDGDSYALIDRSQLYCGSCYKRQIPPCQVQTIQEAPWNHEGNEKISIIKKPPHSIRLVEIPWRNENKNSITLSIDDESSGASVRISE